MTQPNIHLPPFGVAAVDSDEPEREVPPVTPGHVWRHCLAAGVAEAVTHQFPAEQGPDDENIMTALCEHEVMANRVLADADSVAPPFCIHCILVTGRRAAADQDAERDRVRARFAASSAPPIASPNHF